MRQTLLETILEDVSPFLPDPGADGQLKTGEVLSLLYPTPDFAGDHDKFDLVKKNLLSRLDADGPGPAALRAKVREIVASLGQGDLPAGGFAIFADADRAKYLPLSETPRPRLQMGPAALAMPVFADAKGSKRFWIAVLDVERPMLYHVVDGVVHDRTPKKVRTLTQEMAMYEPMASTLWHSSSSVRRSGARQQFHALGTATEDLKNDEIVRVLTDFGKQVDDIVEGPDPLLLAGGPSRTGHFREHFSHRNLLDADIHAAGEALEEDELLRRAHKAVQKHMDEEQAREISDLDTSGALTSQDELFRAAVRGRLDTVLLHPDHQGFLLGHDERLKLPDEKDEAFEERSLIVSYAVKNGARLIIDRRHTESTGIAATTRYDS